MRRAIRAAFWVTAVSAAVAGAFTAAGIVMTRAWTEATECEPATKCEKQPFDSRLWKAYGNWTDPVRLRMVDDLSASYGLRRKSRGWIDEQLGTPEKENPFVGTCDYVFWLGPARSLIATEFEYLCLSFAADAVIDARIVRDQRDER
jgi:hypothetical protein